MSDEKILKTQPRFGSKYGFIYGTGLVPCPDLGSGWYFRQIVRQQGSSAGQFDVYYYSPEEVRIRSKLKLKNYIGNRLCLDNFNFNAGRFLKKGEVVLKKDALLTNELRWFKTVSKGAEFLKHKKKHKLKTRKQKRGKYLKKGLNKKSKKDSQMCGFEVFSSQVREKCDFLLDTSFSIDKIVDLGWKYLGRRKKKWYTRQSSTETVVDKKSRCGHCVRCTAHDCGNCFNCKSNEKKKKKRGCIFRMCPFSGKRDQNQSLLVNPPFIDERPSVFQNEQLIPNFQPTQTPLSLSKNKHQLNSAIVPAITNSPNDKSCADHSDSYALVPYKPSIFTEIAKLNNAYVSCIAFDEDTNRELLAASSLLYESEYTPEISEFTNPGESSSNLIQYNCITSLDAKQSSHNELNNCYNNTSSGIPGIQPIENLNLASTLNDTCPSQSACVSSSQDFEQLDPNNSSLIASRIENIKSELFEGQLV